MDQSIRAIYPLIISLPLMMAALVFIKFMQKRKIQFYHLVEFYLSLSFVIATTLLLWPSGPAFIVLSMIPWIWFLRTFGLICEDITGVPMFKRWHYFALSLGGVISLVLLSFNFTLPWITAPFSLSIGLIGLTFIFQAFQRGTPRSEYGILHHLNLFLGLVFLLSRLSFSIWITDPSRSLIGPLIDIHLTLFFCASLYPLYVELVQEKRERFLESVLKERNKQLFSHSGFSEFKILSAGISHEINNALTVINTKIEQILRGTEKDTEKGIRTVLTGTNRIVRSMRGLRDFIYPQEISEYLDLGKVVEDVLSLYGQRLINHGVKVITQGLSERTIYGQRVQLEQLFLILINNSVDSLGSSPDKWISIKAYSQEDRHIITFEDSSASRVKDILPLLDDPFFTTEKLMDDDIRLALAKDIVKKHKGTLLCPLGKEHTTFIIELPLIEAISESHQQYNDINTGPVSLQ